MVRDHRANSQRSAAPFSFLHTSRRRHRLPGMQLQDRVGGHRHLSAVVWITPSIIRIFKMFY